MGAAVSASVEVKLGNDMNRFAPGDYVAGVINVRPGRASRWARVRLVLVERSRGHYVTNRTEARLSVRLVDGTCHPYPFNLLIAADSPPTFDTANGSLAWGVGRGRPISLEGDWGSSVRRRQQGPGGTTHQFHGSVRDRED